MNLMCFAWISEQTAIISLYSIKLSVFIIEAECLLRGTNWAFKSDRHSFVLKGLITDGRTICTTNINTKELKILPSERNLYLSDDSYNK